MKIGIITFHFAHNYGAMLQAYALEEAIINLGHDVYIIDYRPEYHLKWFKREISWRSCITKSILLSLKLVINKIYNNSKNIKRFDNFQKFIYEHFKLYHYSENDDLHNFDAIILGSDQIWNIKLTNNSFNNPYWGVGIRCNNIISYAASSVYQNFSNEEISQLKIILKHISSIGVREQSLKNILQPLTEKEIQINIDPTLLIDKNIFNDFNHVIPKENDYVLIYELNPHHEVFEIACNYADENKCKIIALTGNISYKTMNKNYDLTASPEKFISYIKNANCIFTTSFHGVALSILFEKKFYAIRQNSNVDNRIESLLKQLNILNQFITMIDRPINCKIDYSRVNYKLEDLRNKSLKYLKDALRIK